ncbi:sister chromatid cohesion 1 protein 3-like [Actinia tenebrosa]|uniref:Sister chromatid cohesion 1 protein 3-like n=1 Tax=Actinia tenebrosa TaxID=6105 RepID=A0A6P8HMX4_ACTTE|nr:sister chromatid cohesion 1 protein 3-like [Actinia tenebrosa]
MFYSQNILTRKGKLGIIWLAATYKGPKNKYLSSKDFKKVNIIRACEYIMHPTLPFALRLSSTLLVGVVRVYREQTRIILIEANEMVKAVSSAIAEKRLSKELQMASPEQKRDTITLPLLLDYDMEFPECQEQIHTDHLVAFAKVCIHKSLDIL